MIRFCGTLLALTFWAFLGLKLSGAWATVPWPVITAPVWGGAALFGAFLAGIIVAILIDGR